MAYNQKQSSLLKNPLQPSQLITPYWRPTTKNNQVCWKTLYSPYNWSPHSDGLQPKTIKSVEKSFTALTNDHPIVTAYNQKQSSLLKTLYSPHNWSPHSDGL